MSPMPARLAILAAAAAVLALSMLGGLARLGIPSATPTTFVVWHGAIVVHGAFGVLIGLERAAARRRRLSMLGPTSSAVGAALFALGHEAWPAFVLGALFLFADTWALERGHRDASSFALASGAASLAFAALLGSAHAPTTAIVPAWIAFLVLTIAGERFATARIARPGRAAFALLGVVLGLVVSSVLATPWDARATRLFGLGLLSLAAWLARFDVARKTVRFTGLPRFAAVSLLAGYVWLAVGGALLVKAPLIAGSPHLDAAVHAILIGFVLSMVFAHGPTILAALVGRQVTYHARLYLPLAVLHVSVALRLVGDALAHLPLRRAAGVLHLIALATFAALMALTGHGRTEPRHAL